MSMFRLAVSAEMVFLDLPFEERVRRIADLGFEVEIWDWTTKDIDALAKTGARFSSMTGYIRGTLADPRRRAGGHAGDVVTGRPDPDPARRAG